MKETYLIIETGCEGIESLLWLAETKEEAIEKVKDYREKIIEEKIQHRKKMNEWWRKENSPELCESEELTDEEKQNLRDFICVQKWNGKRFACACGELHVNPSKLMLR
jgi:hypothetical protein